MVLAKNSNHNQNEVVPLVYARVETIKGKIVAISGSGNVSQYATEKTTQFGGKVVTLSDSDGFIYDPEGVTPGKKMDFFFELKQIRHGRIKEYAEEFEGVEYYPNKQPWEIPVQIAMPCATENEIDISDAQQLIDNGLIAVSEGANMPTTLEATELFLQNKIIFGPGKAVNAGGVATSGLEMAQNNQIISWSANEVDNRLRQIMTNIHLESYKTSKEDNDPENYVLGANITGFKKVAAAMVAQGHW